MSFQVADSSPHDTARSGFQRQSDAYLHGRPSYPPASVEWITARLGRDAGPVADVGAGTGALSVLLAERLRTVVAIEPVTAMIDRCSSRLPRAQAAAARLPFRDSVLGGITVGTAFHWFATADVLDEFHRCLAGEASLILLWNERDHRVPWIAEHNALVDPYAKETPRFVTMEWRKVVDAHPGFAERDCARIPNPTPTTRQGLVDRIVSTSFIAALPEREFRRVRQRATVLAESLPESFDYPYVTRIWCYRRRSRAGESPSSLSPPPAAVPRSSVRRCSSRGPQGAADLRT
jgi:SAM-dependent methyltransferase